LFFGGYIFFNWQRNKEKNLSKIELFFVGTLSLILIYLAVDELAIIHENISGYIQEFNKDLSTEIQDTAREEGYKGSLWIVYYVPVMITLAIPLIIGFLVKAYRRVGIKILLLGVLGLCLIASVPVVEIINTSSELNKEIYNLWMSLEEGLEMVGITCLGYCSYVYINQLLNLQSHKNRSSVS
jgi:hypothetical protein